MWLRYLDVRDFLSFKNVHVDFDRPLTVLTGPNGAGKSTVIRCLRVVKDAVSSFGSPVPDLTREYAGAGHDGVRKFEIRLALQFDRADEKALISAFYRAAVLHGIHPTPADPTDLATSLVTAIGEHGADPLQNGILIVAYDAASRASWQVGWEFTVDGRPAYINLLGPGGEALALGTWSAHDTTSLVVREIDASGDLANLLGKDPSPRLDITSLLASTTDGLRLVVAPANTGGSEAADLRDVFSAVGFPNDGMTRQAHFGHVLHSILSRRLQLTDNARVRPRTIFAVDELSADADLSGGDALAVQLFRWKNGGPDARASWSRVQHLHAQLLGGTVELVTELRQNGPDTTVADLVPVLVRSTSDAATADVPSRLAGEGEIEALLLAALLVDDTRCVVLDEPGVYLSPSAQRRLLTAIANRCTQHHSQVVLVTHNPDLVPVNDPTDLDGLLRLHRTPSTGTLVSRVTRNADSEQRLVQRLRSSETRALLFAAGVVLTEGETEAAALQEWLNGAGPSPSPQQLNVTWFAVGSDTAFGSIIELLQDLAIPWAVLADGPALRPLSALARQLRKLGYEPPAAGATLASVRDTWAACGVYSLATEFGDDGSKDGEIEAFFRRVDATLYTDLEKAYPRSKPRLGAAFAQEHPACPPEVEATWDLIRQSLVPSEA